MLDRTCILHRLIKLYLQYYIVHASPERFNPRPRFSLFLKVGYANACSIVMHADCVSKSFLQKVVFLSQVLTRVLMYVYTNNVTKTIGSCFQLFTIELWCPQEIQRAHKKRETLVTIASSNSCAILVLSKLPV